MTDKSSLDSVFDDSQESDAQDNESTEETEEQSGEQQDTEQSEGDKQTQEKGESEPPADKDEQEWTKKAVIDERRKRQYLETENATLKAQLEKAGKANKSEESEETQEISPEESAWRNKTEILREMAIEKYEDYEEMETQFLDMVKENPSLVAEMRKASNPAKFAYQAAKNHLENQKLSDPEYLKKREQEIYEKAKKDVLAEIEAQQESPEQKRKKSALSVPNFTKATSMSSNSERKLELKSLSELFED